MINLKNVSDTTNEPTEQDKILFSLIDKFVELYSQKAGNIEWYDLSNELIKETESDGKYYEIATEADVYKAMKDREGLIFMMFCKGIAIKDIRAIYMAGMMAGSSHRLLSMLEAARKQARTKKVRQW